LVLLLESNNVHRLFTDSKISWNKKKKIIAISMRHTEAFSLRHCLKTSCDSIMLRRKMHAPKVLGPGSPG